MPIYTSYKAILKERFKIKIKILSSKNYADNDKDYGDCILIDSGKDLVVYDCGSQGHAERVIEYMQTNNYTSIRIVLSHNDSDHFDGIPYLIENTEVTELNTLLLLKYTKELYDKIDDKRLTRDSIARRIKEIYDNIYSLSGTVSLGDIFVDKDIVDGINIAAPDKEYVLDAVAKRLDNRESDSIDKETIVNAVSTQVAVEFDNNKLLLTGDSSFDSLSEHIQDYSLIQLPHHGKLEQAERIFDEMYGNNDIIYFVSDNKGTTNGGSSDLPKSGYNIKNTLDGDVVFANDSSFYPRYIGSLGRNT